MESSRNGGKDRGNVMTRCARWMREPVGLRSGVSVFPFCIRASHPCSVSAAALRVSSCDEETRS